MQLERGERPVKYMVAVVITDLGSPTGPDTVPFFTDTHSRAMLLRDLLRTARESSGGGVLSYGRDNKSLLLRDVLEPARLEQ
jgi:hypothetical protein